MALILALVYWLTGSSEGRYDLGTATNDAAGLSGHLYVEWEQQLTYRLKIEPSDPDQKAGFSLAVGHPPRPLGITIHLQNAEGFVLCSREIVLKYDPRSAAADAHPDAATDVEAVQTDASDTAANHLAQELAFVQLDAQEAAREQGNDVFQNEIGPDGQIAAISAQGAISCTEKAYENAVGWSFTPDFPVIAEQNELVKRQQEERAEAARLAAEARRKKTPRPAIKLLPFSMEGDDSIVEFDPVHGIIETDGDKTFYFNKTAAGMNPGWQEYPVSIHYRCDRASNCVIMHSGAGALRARMKR